MNIQARKIWLVAGHEYLKAVKKRAFILSTLGIPVLITAVMAISIYMAIGRRDTRPLGYIDQSGLLVRAIQPTPEGNETLTELRALPDLASAQAALEKGEIQGFYVLPADYLQTQQVELYYWEQQPGEGVRDDFARFMRVNLAADLPTGMQQRALQGTSLTVRALDSKRTFSEKQFINLILPFAAGFFLFFAVMSSSGYMLQAVADEKENRTIEVLATSLSAGQLVTGKALGTMAIAITQLLVWGVTVAIGLMVGARFWDVLGQAVVPWDFLLIVLLYFMPAYALIVGVMTAIGASVNETRQGQQIAGVINLIFTVPFFFTPLVFANPNNPILVVLTLFPSTAFLTVALRWPMTAIPLWQMALSWVLLVGTAAASVWAAARVMRAHMLRYGQRFSLRSLIQAIQGK